MYDDPSVEQTSVFEEFAPQLIYASVGQRFVNFLIDLIPIYALIYAFSFLFGVIMILCGTSQSELHDFIQTPQFTLVSYGIVIVAHTLYYTIVEGASKGRTLGKLVSGTKVVQEDGQKITWKQAFLRSLCRLIPFDGLSAFSSHPWHDTITKTSVIKKIITVTK